MLGKDFSGADLFKRTSAAGWYYTGSNLSDSVQRLIAYRSVNGFPLVITVGLASHEIFSRLDAQKQSGYFIAIVIGGAPALQQQRSLASFAAISCGIGAKRRLEHTNMLLNATLENMPQGICMFGADERLVLANDLYSKMYRLSPEDVKPGTTLPEILPGANSLAGSCTRETHRNTRQGPDRGGIPARPRLRHQRASRRAYFLGEPQGHAGWRFGCRSHQDITAHLHAERELGEAKQFLNSIIEHVPVAVVVKRMRLTTRKDCACKSRI